MGNLISHYKIDEQNKAFIRHSMNRDWNNPPCCNRLQQQKQHNHSRLSTLTFKIYNMLIYMHCIGELFLFLTSLVFISKYRIRVYVPSKLQSAI